MKTILVTGGAGFIGGCFVRQMIAAQSSPIVVLDKLTYAGNLDSLASISSDPSYTFVQGDVADRGQVDDIFRQVRPSAVVHFAAESHVDRSIDSPDEFVRSNVMGTFNLLDAARHYWRSIDQEARENFRFLHISTDEVYGSLGDMGRFTETSPYAPNSPYSASKAASDHFARAYYHTYGLPVLVTNCSNNFGPYQFPEKLVPLMILNAMEGKPLPVYGDGLNVRDWLYVEDHCEALRCVLERGQPGEVYNIGGDAERTNLEIVNMICDEVDRLCPDLQHRPCRSLITFVTDRPGHDRRYAIDATKIRTTLGWVPRQGMETWMRKTVQWYLDNRHWVERVTSGAYRRERLGLGQVS